MITGKKGNGTVLVSVSVCGCTYVLFVFRCDASSPYIHPVGYCEEVGLTLTTPAGEVLLWFNVHLCGEFIVF